MELYISYSLLMEYADYVISCICLGSNIIMSFKDYIENKDLDDYYNWLSLNTLEQAEEDKREWFN